MWPTRPGAAGAGVLLVEDHLLGERCAAAAVHSGPAEADPAAAPSSCSHADTVVEADLLVAGAAAATSSRAKSPTTCSASQVWTSVRNSSSWSTHVNRGRGLVRLLAGRALHLLDHVEERQALDFTVAGSRSSISSGVQRPSLYIARTSLGWLHTATLLPTTVYT